MCQTIADNGSVGVVRSRVRRLDDAARIVSAHAKEYAGELIPIDALAARLGICPRTAGPFGGWLWPGR